MSRLVCLLKGCGISATKGGLVVCPDCQMNYCWDKIEGPWGKVYYGSTGSSSLSKGRYPFGNWIPCEHGSTCKNRRLHKNRRDSLAAFVLENEKVGTRHERYRKPSTDMQRQGT